MKLTDRIIPIMMKSEYFECRKCGYSEPRLVKGDIAYSPCPNCGNTPMYRM